jgi:hypothetical protein
MELLVCGIESVKRHTSVQSRLSLQENVFIKYKQLEIRLLYGKRLAVLLVGDDEVRLRRTTQF